VLGVRFGVFFAALAFDRREHFAVLDEFGRFFLAQFGFAASGFGRRFGGVGAPAGARATGPAAAEDRADQAGEEGRAKVTATEA
jgi:hypothetical protein